MDRHVTCADFLCHYYDAEKGPFLNLSDFALAEAEQGLDQIRRKGESFASKRGLDYLTIRRELETGVRQLFIAKGGKPVRERPHHMIVGACPRLIDWYKDGRELRVPLTTFRPEIVRLYGLPQEWNPDGEFGPDRYNEAQVWDDAPIKQCLK